MRAQFHWHAYCFQIRSVTGPFPTDHPDGADEFKDLRFAICDFGFGRRTSRHEFHELTRREWPRKNARDRKEWPSSSCLRCSTKLFVPIRATSVSAGQPGKSEIVNRQSQITGLDHCPGFQ